MTKQLNSQINGNLRTAVTLMLWKSGAVKVNLDEPFKLVSGNYSPIYINCRQVISDPHFMSVFNAAARFLLMSRDADVNMIAGGVTAGVPFAAYLAHDLNLPLIYVRKAQKGYGLSKQIEGGDPNGSKVLLVEDLITDAGSKVNFIEALRDGGAIVAHTLVLFDRLQGGTKSLKEMGVALHSVTNMDLTLDIGESSGLFKPAVIDSVRSYIADPKAWHETMNLEYVS